jgi:hypothetical protein
MRLRDLLENAATYPSVKVAEQLRGELAAAAQKVYDAWEQDEEGYDEVYAGGGVCHDIASEMAGVLNNAGIDAYTVSSNHEVHVYVVAPFAEGVYEIDIPYRLYEIGGGYTWQKIPDVVFTPDFVHIGCLDADPENIGMYAGED